MRNSETLSTKREVDLGQLGMMMRLVAPEMANPNDSIAMANLISETFDVDCTAENIEDYESAHILVEDFELESRRTEYGQFEGDY